MNPSSLSHSARKASSSLSDPGTISFRNEKLQQAASSVKRQAWPFLASYEEIPALRINQPGLDLNSFVS